MAEQTTKGLFILWMGTRRNTLINDEDMQPLMVQRSLEFAEDWASANRTLAKRELVNHLIMGLTALLAGLLIAYGYVKFFAGGI